MIVIKFGGTSVGDASRVATAIDIVAGRVERGPIVVVSALSGVTNELVAATKLAAAGEFDGFAQKIERIRQRHEDVALELVKKKSDYFQSFLAQLQKQIDQIDAILRGIALVGEVTPRANDKIVAIGEKLSSVLFAYSMRMRTLPGVHVDSETVVVTDDRFGEAVPIMEDTRKRATEILRPEIERRHIPVMGGFIGRSLSGATTTLGRGGSDYSASIIGAAIDAEEIQIWTDVDGMMTCDPRLIPSARIISEISYDEAAELAYFGAKVLHPKTIEPAVERGIPIRVLNTHNLESPGTQITRDGGGAIGPLAIALKKGITVIHVASNQMLGAHGFLARMFEIFNRFGVSVDLITTSEVSVSLTIDDRTNLQPLLEALRPIADVRVDEGQAIVALVGRKVMHDVRTGARIFDALEGRQISMMTMGSSDLNVSIVLPESDVDGAVKSLHAALFENTPAEVA